jgi:hypothetical protein
MHYIFQLLVKLGKDKTDAKHNFSKTYQKVEYPHALYIPTFGKVR